MSWLSTLDRQVLLWMREPADTADALGPDWLQRAAIDVTSLGGTTVLTLLVILVAGFLLLDGRRAAAFLVLGTGIGASLLTTGLKHLFGRARPEVVEHLVSVSTLSFPSGHSLSSAAIYLTLGAMLARSFARPALRRFCVTAAILLALLIGLSRIYLGVHWPSDVLVGWSLGALWAWGCWCMARYVQQPAAGAGT